MANGAVQARNTGERAEPKNAGVAPPKLALFVTRPRGEYKFLVEKGPSYLAVSEEDVVVASFFTETNQFMVTNQRLAESNLGYEINDVTQDIALVKTAINADLQERVKFLHHLMDDFGFRIYALFVLGIVDDGVFRAFDIYAGVAGQGSFLPLDQVKMFLEQVNIAEVTR
jgi:hypothetical protein